MPRWVFTHIHIVDHPDRTGAIIEFTDAIQERKVDKYFVYFGVKEEKKPKGWWKHLTSQFSGK